MSDSKRRALSSRMAASEGWRRRCEDGWPAWEKPADCSTWSCCKGWAPGWTPGRSGWRARRFGSFWWRSCCKCGPSRARSSHWCLTRAQQEYEGRCGKKNIVLKARQLGITTYVAARFFVHTITRRGTLSVQVAHNQDSAEEIFRIVHRFLENLPERLQAGALCTSRANVRQVVFPRLDSEYRVETAADPNAGRGMTIQNLHCSEVARWPGDAAETLAGLRAAVPPGGEIVLESTANGAAGAFYAEWQRAEETGYVRHFFPWWWEPSYRLARRGRSAS